MLSVKELARADRAMPPVSRRWSGHRHQPMTLWQIWPKLKPTNSKKLSRTMHDGAATFAKSVPVRETFEGKAVWEGVMHVFDLAASCGDPRVSLVIGDEGSTKRRFFAVVHTARINSPV